MLSFIVEQRSIDIVLRIYSAEGKFVDRKDSPNGREGDKPLKIVSLISGVIASRLLPVGNPKHDDWQIFCQIGRNPQNNLMHSSAFMMAAIRLKL